MTNKNTIVYVLTCLLILGFTACRKKDLPAEVSNDPRFYFTGKLNNEEVKFEAGNSDYYMYATYFLDTNSIYVYKAELKPKNCTSSCSYAITLLINDARILSPTEGMKPEEALYVGEYFYNGPAIAPKFYKAEFAPLNSNNDVKTFEWKFNSKNVSEVTMNSYRTTQIFEAGKEYSVNLHYDDGVGCNASHLNTFKAGSLLQTNITAQRQTPNIQLIYNFTSSSSYTGNLYYLWDFGDGTPFSTETSPTHTYTAIGGGHYLAKLRLINDLKDTCISYYQLQASLDPSCDANYNTTITAIPNSRAFSSITVLVTSSDGTVYSSRNALQPSSSKFEILSVTDYIRNENKELTKSLSLKFNCLLQSGTKQLLLENGKAVMAVSYQK